ncbi:MAG: MOSC domain-containing protein [Candidatus Rariloculaceae bacterium]
MSRITQINLYPIKSCAGISVESARLGSRGLSEDRCFMLVDIKGRFLTQRDCPSMSRIMVKRNIHGWTIEKEGQKSLNLPANLPTDKERIVLIWRDQINVAVASDKYNQWFSEAIGIQCELVQMKDQHLRSIQPDRGRTNDLVSLADGSPVLLTSEASLFFLNQRLLTPVPMARFRPNIVVSADTAFVEDNWRQIRVGEVEFEVGWSCTRCIVTTIDPMTSQKDINIEPIKTLKEFRSSPDGVIFGQNLIPRKLGIVKVGDVVEVLKEID